MRGRRALWRCPRCRRSFANRNHSHACGRYISQRNHVHHFRLTALSDVDAEFRGFLREAYAVGQQRHLASKAT